jgi:hypothetical protein
VRPRSSCAAILSSPFSSASCTRAIRSLLGTPRRDSRSPPVMLTAVISQPNPAARSMSTTGAPTPVPSTTTAQRPVSAGSHTISQSPTLCLRHDCCSRHKPPENTLC